jgi:hypothetical protein
MDFWVTVATVLPIIGLPLVLTARVHVAQCLDRPLLARMAAGLYAMILMAIYVMEGFAVWQLARSTTVPGSEWLQGAAVAVVWFAGGMLIFSPGYLLLRISFAGPGLGLKSAVIVPAGRTFVWLLDLRDSVSRRLLARQIQRHQKNVVRQGEKTFRAWDGATGQGMSVMETTDAALNLRLERVRQGLIAALATAEIHTWRLHYVADRRRQIIEPYRLQVLEGMRRAIEANLHAVWQVFDDWTAEQHHRQRRQPGLDPSRGARESRLQR